MALSEARLAEIASYGTGRLKTVAPTGQSAAGCYGGASRSGSGAGSGVVGGSVSGGDGAA